MNIFIWNNFARIIFYKKPLRLAKRFVIFILFIENFIKSANFAEQFDV